MYASAYVRTCLSVCSRKYVYIYMCIDWYIDIKVDNFVFLCSCNWGRSQLLFSNHHDYFFYFTFRAHCFYFSAFPFACVANISFLTQSCIAVTRVINSPDRSGHGGVADVVRRQPPPLGQPSTQQPDALYRLP